MPPLPSLFCRHTPTCVCSLIPRAHPTPPTQECLAAERAAPLLPQLGPWVGPERRLVAAAAACQQFQALVDMFAGPRERGRWSQLLARLEVFTTGIGEGVLGPGSAAAQPQAAGLEEAGPEVVVRATGTGEQEQGGRGQTQLAAAAAAVSERVRALRHLGAPQVAVFGLGDALRALTLTANGNAVRGAEEQGCVLEVQLHRPVWLTGR